MRSHFFLIDLMLLSLAGLTGYLFWTTSPYQSIPTHTSRFYDAFAQAVTSIQYDANGHKRYEFQSPALQHYPANNITMIQDPIFYMYNAQGEAWKISAFRAKAMNGLKEIQLTDNVTISGEQTKAFKDARLFTQQVQYYPDESVALTYNPVTIVQPGTHVTADGMTAYFKESRLSLLSEVKGEYRLDSPILFSGDTMEIDYLNHITTLTGHASAKTEKKGSLMTATADIIRYDQTKRLAVLSGNAQTTDGINTLNSPDIDYWIDQARLISKTQPGQRFSIHINPSTP